MKKGDFSYVVWNPSSDASFCTDSGTGSQDKPQVESEPNSDTFENDGNPQVEVRLDLENSENPPAKHEFSSSELLGPGIIAPYASTVQIVNSSKSELNEMISFISSLVEPV